ncbi:hypothetical protein B9Z55_004089 [Caenorhabditis nigoni]|uniref:Uncharacterized protein n=1 Tax=Caenorhabditis nigoni TaxID=1611254 RepID=A0A2G5UVB1_9PELO|nr:hypothetical protein B9Z55_004089 [Caenorhabditis nigoni]
MPTESIATDVTTLKIRAMASLINGGIQGSNPSISPDSIVEIAPRMITMKFPASEFYYGGILNRTNLNVVCQAVARASWEVTLDMVDDDAHHGLQNDIHFNSPRPEEEVVVTARARQLVPRADELGYEAVVKRDGADLTISVGYSYIHMG